MSTSRWTGSRRSVSVRRSPTRTATSIYLDLTFACTWLGGEARVADDENADALRPVDALPDMSSTLVERIDAALSGEVAARLRPGPGRVVAVGRTSPRRGGNRLGRC